MARASNTQERRAQIAAALLKVMARRGYDGATIADVAGAAGLTSGLVHYHFENKLEILLAALAGLVDGHERRLAGALSAAAGDRQAQVGAFIDFHLGVGADSDPEALSCWVLLGGEALRQPSVGAAYAAALASSIDRLATLIRNGVAEGAFRCSNVAEAACAIAAAIEGYFILAATARAVIPPGSAATCVKQMAEGLLRPARPFAGEAHL